MVGTLVFALFALEGLQVEGAGDVRVAGGVCVHDVLPGGGWSPSFYHTTILILKYSQSYNWLCRLCIHVYYTTIRGEMEILPKCI